MSLTDNSSDTASEIERLEGELRKARGRRDGWMIAMFIASVMALALAAIFVGIGVSKINTDSGAGGSSAPSSITSELVDYKITFSGGEIAEGGSISVSNNGSMAHNLAVKGTEIRTANINPGASATLNLAGLVPGTYTLICEIAGHEALGMTAQLTIVAGGGSGGSAAGGGGGTTDPNALPSDLTQMTPEQSAAHDKMMMDSIAAYPVATEGVGNQVLEPTILADGTKHFDLTASVIDWEVTPGKIVKAWAYNNQVPGPRFNLEVGDKVEVTIVNELPMGTDIHWHGIDVPFNQDGVAPITQPIIGRGETYTYNFTTTEPGIGMYHAHAHGQVQVPNGLFGAMYVGEVPMPEGRTVSGIDMPATINVAQDIPMVLNDAGVIGLTLNGKGFPATEPIVVNENEWVKVTYFNEGLQVHPMHLHGFKQIVYAKDGIPLDAPYAADTILVGPGERYTVLFQAKLNAEDAANKSKGDDPVIYVFHCHILTHVESDTGMFGMVTAVVVNPV